MMKGRHTARVRPQTFSKQRCPSSGRAGRCPLTLQTLVPFSLVAVGPQGPAGGARTRGLGGGGREDSGADWPPALVIRGVPKTPAPF